MNTAEQLYSLKLHEMMPIGRNAMAMRVPGGWFYSDMHGSAFVPFHNEFQEVQPTPASSEAVATKAKPSKEGREK